MPERDAIYLVLCAKNKFAAQFVATGSQADRDAIRQLDVILTAYFDAKEARPK